MKRLTMVILQTPGYTNRAAVIDSPAVSHQDGTKQYRVVLRGVFTTLTFREDEFRVATAEELEFLAKHPNERYVP